MKCMFPVSGTPSCKWPAKKKSKGMAETMFGAQKFGKKVNFRDTVWFRFKEEFSDNVFFKYSIVADPAVNCFKTPRSAKTKGQTCPNLTKENSALDTTCMCPENHTGT